MEKYGTYKIYKHKKTGEIKRLPVQDPYELEKISSLDEWEEIFEEKEEEVEDKD